ncbi:major capsid protein, partial [Klebsiella pneumoniae]|nr:major capsid protein [Klebsiella pneumoniae]
FEDVTGGIRLIPSSPRGAPPSQRANPTGALRYLNAQRFAREVEINADELLAARVRGGDVAQTLQNLIMERVDGPIGV